MHRSTLLATVALTLLGCRGHPDGLDHIPVERAYLDDVRLVTVALVGGVVTGEGTLVIEQPNGLLRGFPVELQGGTVGVAFEIDLDGPIAINRAELVLPDERITGNQLLGRYHGGSLSLTPGIGVDGHFLRNKHKVRLNKAYLSVGAGVHAGVEWIRVDLKPVEDDDTDETVGTDSQGAWTDSSVVWTDSGMGYDRYERSGGCGCSGPPEVRDTSAPSDTDGADSDSEGTPTEPEPSTPDETTEPAASGDAGSGCDCSSGSDGCGCASTRAVQTWWLAVLMLPWVRRRRDT